jgi:hypothetical protein
MCVRIPVEAVLPSAHPARPAPPALEEDVELDHQDKVPSWLELESIKPLAECEKITSLSADSLRRTYGHLIVHLSGRRRGMKLRHVLQIAAGQADAATPTEEIAS